MLRKSEINKQGEKPVNNTQAKSKAGSTVRNNLRIIISLMIVSIFTLIIFYPSINNDFTNWDDPVYVTQDTMIFDLKYENIKEIFIKPISFNYHPLTMLSLAIDYKTAFNKESKTLSARNFHITNLIIHILNVILVFILIYLVTGKNIAIAFIVSILFGIHPLRVESVAWISERKDVLYSFFYLSSLIFYLKFLKNRGNKLYLLILTLFICSILSKAMAITLPLVFFLIDYYTGRTFSKSSFLEKVPFIILSIIFGIIAIKIQSDGGAITNVFGLFDRISVASYGFIIYLYKFLIPVNLSTYYPYPFHLTSEILKIPYWFYFFPVLVMIITGVLFITRKYMKIVIFGFLFYFITIVMVLQFVSVGTVIIADRYTYIAYIGLFFIIAHIFNCLNEKHRKDGSNNSIKYFKYLFIILLTIYILFCSYLTRSRLKVWQNSETLWSDVINKYPGEFEAGYLNRAYYYYLKGLETKNQDYINKSVEDYKVLIKMKSKNAFVYSVMGNLSILRNDPVKAIAYYDEGIKLDSSNYNTLINRALTYIKINKYDSSLKDIEKVLSINKQRQAYVLQAYDYFMLSDFEKSETLYSKLILKYPDYYDSFYYRGISYYKLHKYDLALSDFKKFLNHNNQKPDVMNYISEINKIKNNSK